MPLEDTIKKLLFKNRRHSRGYQFTVPSPTSYPYQWLWDSCFHSIILSHLNLKDSKKELLSIVSKQFPNGMLPHMIYWKKPTILNIKWGTQGTSSITQPPMLAYAAWQIYSKDKDQEFLSTLYQPMYHFYKYLLNQRDPHERHLIGIINPDESGEDNSPRFDIPLGLPPVQTEKENFQKRLNLNEDNKKCGFDAPFCMRNFFWVKDVPFNSIMVENLGLLSKIAEVLGFEDDAEYFEQEKQRIVAAMRERMLEDGIFWSTFGKGYEKIKIKTWAMFAPMFAHILTPLEAEHLVNKHLLNEKEFLAKFLVPTVAMDEPSFDPKGFWRGPIWFSTNWFIYKGLINYGFIEIAQKVKQSSLDLIEKNGFREQFDPLTGEGMGAKNFTWGGLTIDMGQTSPLFVNSHVSPHLRSVYQ